MIPLKWSTKMVKLRETDSRMVVARDGGEGEEIVVQQVHSFSYKR